MILHREKRGAHRVVPAGTLVLTVALTPPLKTTVTADDHPRQRVPLVDPQGEHGRESLNVPDRVS